MGLIVLPTRALKAKLFTPVIAVVLSLVRRLSLGVCACGCWPAKWRRDVEEALDKLEGKESSLEADGDGDREVEGDGGGDREEEEDGDGDREKNEDGDGDRE